MRALLALHLHSTSTESDKAMLHLHGLEAETTNGFGTPSHLSSTGRGQNGGLVVIDRHDEFVLQHMEAAVLSYSRHPAPLDDGSLATQALQALQNAAPLLQKRLDFCAIPGYAILAFASVMAFLAQHPDTLGFSPLPTQPQTPLDAPSVARTFALSALATSCLFNLLSGCASVGRAKGNILGFAMAVNAVAALYYLTAGTSLSPMYLSATGRPTPVLRHLSWLFTTSCMLLMLVDLTPVSRTKAFELVANNVVSVLLSIPALFAPASYAYLALGVESVIVIVLLSDIIRSVYATRLEFLSIEKSQRQGVSSFALAMAVILAVVTWLQHPVIALLGRLDVVSFATEEVLFTVCDVIGKVLYTASVMYGALAAYHKDAVAQKLWTTACSSLSELDLQASETFSRKMAAVLFHEVQTPLQGILGLVGTIKVHPEDTRSRANVSRMQSLAQQVLLFIEDVICSLNGTNANIELDRQPVSLHRILQEVIDTFDVPERDRAHRSVSLNPEVKRMPQVYADPVRIAQVVVALVSPMLRETRCAVKVTSSQDAAPSFVCVSVTNTMQRPDAKVVQTFWSTESKSHKQRLHAYGLAQRLVELHGGVVRMEGDPSWGVSYMFTLPMFDESQGRRLTAALRRSSSKFDGLRRTLSNTPTGSAAMCFALPDEELTTLVDTMTEAAQTFGNANWCTTSKQLIVFLTEAAHVPHVLVLSSALPCDGIYNSVAELLEFVKVMIPTVSVLVLTEVQPQGDDADAIKSLADAVMRKPFTGDKVIAKATALANVAQRGSRDAEAPPAKGPKQATRGRFLLQLEQKLMSAEVMEVQELPVAVLELHNVASALQEDGLGRQHVLYRMWYGHCEAVTTQLNVFMVGGLYRKIMLFGEPPKDASERDSEATFERMLVACRQLLQWTSRLHELYGERPATVGMSCIVHIGKARFDRDCAQANLAEVHPALGGAAVRTLAQLCKHAVPGTILPSTAAHQIYKDVAPRTGLSSLVGRDGRVRYIIGSMMTREGLPDPWNGSQDPKVSAIGVLPVHTRADAPRRGYSARQMAMLTLLLTQPVEVIDSLGSANSHRTMQASRQQSLQQAYGEALEVSKFLYKQLLVLVYSARRVGVMTDSALLNGPLPEADNESQTSSG